jgi:hypothetical protein
MEFELKVIKDGKVSIKTWEGKDGKNASIRYADCFPEESVIAFRPIVHGLFIGYVQGQIIG